VEAVERRRRTLGRGAFNSLDSATRRFALQPGGAYAEVAFPNATARVEEERYEVIATYGKTLSPAVSFQISAGGEYSELAQIGGNGRTRTFQRPKGQASAVWQPEPDTRVNLRLQRRVGQLNFGDFLASVNLSDNRQNAGNADLVPPQSWEAEIETVRQQGAWGSYTVRLYGAKIEDIIDFVPISSTSESVGNLDQALRYGVEWRATTNLDPMGWRGARLDSRFILQDSQVRDPLTGRDREISNSLQRLASLSLRHDVPDTDWAWGAGLSHQRSAPVYRLSERYRQWEIPIGGSVFVEHKNVRGLTVRGTIGNAFSGESYLDRVGFVGQRTGPVAFREKRDRTIGPIFAFEVRGRF